MLAFLKNPDLQMTQTRLGTGLELGYV